MIEVPAISNPSVTITKTLTATALNQDYQLFIALPNGYAESEQRYPVLYVLDGNGLFSFARMIVETQPIFGSLPEMIVVGIGYPVSTYADTVTIRGRDLTLREMTPEEKEGNPYPFEETGKGPQFYAFLRDEVIPAIDREFRTRPDDRALAGWSLSAGFALYVPFQTPLLFRRILAVSGWVGDVVEEAEKSFASHNTSLPVNLFLCMERPQHIPEEKPWINMGIEHDGKWIKGVQKRNYDGFRGHFSVIENADHGQVLPIGLAYGLVDIYKD